MRTSCDANAGCVVERYSMRPSLPSRLSALAAKRELLSGVCVPLLAMSTAHRPIDNPTKVSLEQAGSRSSWLSFQSAQVLPPFDILRRDTREESRVGVRYVRVNSVATVPSMKRSTEFAFLLSSEESTAVTTERSI
jgi:hypothetical protein